MDYERFLEMHYHDEIIELADDPDRNTLVIDFTKLNRFDSEAANQLLEDPDKILANFEQAIQDYPLPVDIDKIKVSIKNLLDSDKVPVHRIGSEHINKLIAVDGRINKAGPVESKLLEGAFKCLRCTTVTYVKQPDDHRYVEPYECGDDLCGRKGPFELVTEESIRVNEQRLELQDLYEYLNPGQPQRDILIHVRGNDLIRSIPAIGAQVIITGIVRTVQKVVSGSKTNLFKLILEAVHIEAVDADTNITLTEADKKQLRALASKSNIFDMLTQSTAPTVLGYQDIKLALLAAAVSGPNYILSDGRHLRGYTHIAICGDPGTGKTVMVSIILSLAPRAQYAAGRGASAVGLTVAVVKDELSGSGYTAQAGALVLADKGLMILDEIDKFKPEDLQDLNTALESGKIHVHKGGLNQTFNARCPVIAVGNPKHIRFDGYEPLTGQIDIPADTLSRFDLVFKICDVPDASKDRKIAEHQGVIWQQAGSKKEYQEIPISAEMLRKYLAYAKTFDPGISADVSEAITDYYLELRKSDSGTIAATARDNDGLHRLTKSMAKLRLSAECSIEDVEKAIQIHKVSLDAIRDPTTGLVDSDILHGMSKSLQDKRKVIIEIIQGLQKDNGNTAFFDDILSIASTKKITRDQATDILRHLKERGDIIEHKSDLYRVRG